MKCPHCNQEHPEGYQFCPNTGKKLETLKACKNPKCPNYNKQILPLKCKFCPTCGQNLEEDTTQPIEILRHLDFKFDDVITMRLIFVKGNDNIPDFYIGDAPITQGVWNFITKQKDKIKNTATGKGVNKPMYLVSIQDAEEFVSKLNNLILDKMKEIMVFKEYTIKRFDLPTEEQWEYVARERDKSDYKYSGSDNLDEVAWYNRNSGAQVHEVKTKKPNGLDIYDMSGNVAEWCQLNPFNGYVAKGGSWDSHERDCRIDSHMCIVSKQLPFATVGFRIVLILERR